jgi:hypothetical protein
MAESYADLLRHPRWQRRRLEIMQRDDFACRECGATEKTLNVHHTVYIKGRKPWEYEDSQLRTLCQDCHHHVTEYKGWVDEILGSMPLAELHRVIGYLTIRLEILTDSKPAGPWCPSSGLGMADALQLTPEEFEQQRQLIPKYCPCTMRGGNGGGVD